MNPIALFAIMLENPHMPNVTFAIALIAVGATVLLYQVIKRKART